MCREYLCDCSNCIDLNFDILSSSELSDDAGDNAREEFEEKEYISYGHHIFDFVEILSCATLTSGCSIELRYSVLVKEKGIEEELSRDDFDNCDMVILMMFFRGNFLKPARSGNSNMKQFQLCMMFYYLLMK